MRAPSSLPRGLVLAFLPMLCAAPALGAQPAGLTVDQAVELALRGSEAVRLRELALQKARLALGEVTAQALPRVDLKASASYLANPPQGYTVRAGELGSFTPTIPTGALGNPVPIPLGDLTIPSSDFTIGSQEHNYFSVSASLSQPLFTWGKIRGAIDLASLAVDAAGNDLAAQRRDMRREVSRAWNGALLASGSEEVLQRLREIAAAVAEDRRKAFDDGTTNREAVLQAQADLAQIEARLLDAGQAGLTARESLGILTGLDPSTITLASGFREALPPLDESALRTAAVASSTDLAAARTRLQQARKKLSVEKGGSLLLPDLALGITFDLTGQEDLPYKDWSWDAGTWNWDVVISLGMKTSVFDGLASANRIAQAERDVDMAGAASAQQEKLVRLTVRQAVEAALRAEAAVKEKQAAWEIARERLRNAQASFDSGLASRADLRGAQILEGTAALDLLAARYAREEALADIERLTGSSA